MNKKKLIEVALPLDKINSASAREKSIRHGHPSTLHLWWARRPLAAARAVIWSSLVDDPSSHPELFPTEEDQNRERQRLFKILEDLVVWENSNNQDILNAAKAEIMKSTNGNPPALLDPFAGGGAIPLEAQRLGLEAHAHDLNPVAVMINKAMIEIPPKFAYMPPVNPDDRIARQVDTWKGAQGLAADVKYYGEWMKREAFKKIGHLYPKVKVPKEQGDGEVTVIAWIWARTVKCPNPACGCEMPLASSFVISKRNGNEAWVKPVIENKKVHFEVQHGKCPKEYESFKQGRKALFKCPSCGEITSDSYVKQCGREKQMHSQLMAIIGEGKKGRVYISPDIEQESVANIDCPHNCPEGEMPNNPRWFSPPAFGMASFNELFTHRQITALLTFTDLISDVCQVIEKDALEIGLKEDHIPLCDGGSGAHAYAEAVSVYLSLAISRMSSYWSNITTYDNTREKLTSVFSRQAIPMSWDYIEANPFSNYSGNFLNSIVVGAGTIEKIPYFGNIGEADQYSAQSDCNLTGIMISTDPPYYDNIGYADLSDFFYIWLRRSLSPIYPKLFRTMLVPKSEELVATPYRFEGSTEKAKAFFENGMLQTCKQLFNSALPDIPVTIYYAYKQNDSGNEPKEMVSSGWETMLSAIIDAGFIITGTWPMRTEMSGRTLARMGTNALASSIVLVCRKRSSGAPQITRRAFINALRRELRPALKQLKESNIAPVDLAQSAIGPGMGVFSRYRKVLEADGTPMTVRNALQIINEEIDLYFNEQVGELDAMSRFCVDLYTQNAFNDIKFGEADVLARAKGTSVAALVSHDVVYAKAGTVHLIERTKLPKEIDENESCIWLLTQQLTQAMATGGVEACAKAVFTMFGSNAERAKDLAYRLYTIAEQKKWASEAFAYNALVVAWPDIQSRAAMMQRERPEQLDMFKMGLLDS